MNNSFIEENGVYQINYEKALWATNKMHDDYHRAKIPINDADFVIEDGEYIFLIEYKNANIPNAVRPHDFNPAADKNFNKIVRKYYDSLHYLTLLGKSTPVQFIYVVEYPHGDAVTRKRLRERLKRELPFSLQKEIGNGIRLIDKVAVVSIDEWNEDKVYGKYPISLVNQPII